MAVEIQKTLFGGRNIANLIDTMCLIQKLVEYTCFVQILVEYAFFAMKMVWNL